MTKISQLPPDTNPRINDLIALVNGSNGVTNRMTLQDFSKIMDKLLNPSGVVKSTAATTAPSGWLICDGSPVLRATYPDLFAAIGTTYGAGDGSTTFNIPDARQRLVMGKAATGTGSVLGEKGGAIDHKHFTGVGFDSGSFYGHGDATGSPIHGSGVATAPQRVTATATATANSNVRESLTDARNPPYIVLNHIIKT